MAWWETILQALWLFLPAYIANMAPVFVAKIIPKWNAPIDGGRVGKDGQRLLGAGKTWRGLAGGAALGGLVAVAMLPIAWSWGLVDELTWGIRVEMVCDGTVCNETFVTATELQAFLFGAIVGAMALVGDAVKSYFKRRRGKEGGAPWFPFDQLDFVVFGLLGMVLASPLIGVAWLSHALLDDWLTLTTIVVLTPGLHLLINRIGFWLGLKKVPW